ncbi:cell wall-associated hydrolase [Paenibacillus sp. 32O-W]|uniref:C40 family peptidase n=1 Tax=Paenibacillus sp. 32O-W TaxID=1695218 RepID=UPI00071F8DC5|nr:cell wall-associated hydrolase [Paenibacillus sp. 32O-W]
MMTINTVKTGTMRIALAVCLTFSAVLPAGLTAQAEAVQPSSGKAEAIIATGMQLIGTPYVFGAKSGQTDAFDCSSFTQYVFRQNGIELPRSSRQQAEVGTAVAKDELQAGDLVFSDTNRDGVINHVSIYAGDGKLLHTYRAGIGVTVSDFEGSTWDKTFVTARRVLPQESVQGDAATDPGVGAPLSGGASDSRGHDRDDDRPSSD